VVTAVSARSRCSPAKAAKCWNALQAEILRDRATVLVVERQQHAVGLLVAWAVPPDELHVMELAVLPEHRRQGLARRLMQQAIDMHR
jgi:ribosomal protein S18 acetylase RimI-like enzyme